MDTAPQLRVQDLNARYVDAIDDNKLVAWPDFFTDNGRYRVPSDNPFVSTRGARNEIWAYGFRNPHRLHFAIDPADAKNNRLIANSIGLHTW